MFGSTPATEAPEAEPITRENYHRHPALGCTDCKRILEGPRICYEHADGDKPAFAVGRAAHALTFEPETADAMFAVAPDERGYGKRDTKAFAEWAEAQPVNRDVLLAKEWEAACNIADAVRSHPMVQRLLEVGEAERVFTATDPHTGLPLKCRADWYHDGERGPCMVDLKKVGDPRTCADLRRFVCGGDVSAMHYLLRRWMYHMQAALYSDVYQWATGKQLTRFVFVFADEDLITRLRDANEPTWQAVAVAPLDWRGTGQGPLVAQGRASYQRALHRYMQWQEADARNVRIMGYGPANYIIDDSEAI